MRALASAVVFAVTAGLVGVAGPLHAQPLSVVPSLRTGTPGNFDNTIPWSDEDPVRYQQVFLGSEVGDIEIRQIRFRQDELWGSPFGGGPLTGVAVVLSSTTAAPDALSMTFSDNLAPDATVVFAGSLNLSSRPNSALPRIFDITVPLASSFVFDPSTGSNLLLDVTIADGPPLASFDAENTAGDSVSRVFCWVDPVCLTTDQAWIEDTVGLVTMFLPPGILSDGFESGDTSAWLLSAP